MIFKNVRFFNELFEEKIADIRIENGIIKTIGVIDAPGRDMRGYIALPGFIDIHIHGASGGDTSDGTVESLEKISMYLAHCGVTSFCPTTMTLPSDQLIDIAKTIASYKGKYSKIVGINFEGPFISKEKKGAQNEKYVVPGNIDTAHKIRDASNGLMKLITIAPEAFDSEKFIKDTATYCKVSIGHSSANAKECKKAIDEGVSHATHLFNAMTPMNHREAGIVGTVLDDKRVTCELICDTFHVCPTVIRNTFKILGDDRGCVVSDSMRAAGLGTGEFELGGQRVYVNENDNVARLKDGTIAASITNVFEEFRNLISIGIDVKTALKSCTINPAKVIGQETNIGSIATGKAADIIFTDEVFNLKEVYINGIRA